MGGDAKTRASTSSCKRDWTLQLPSDELVAALRADLRDTKLSEAQDIAVSIQRHITGAVKHGHGDTPGIGCAANAGSTLVSYRLQTASGLAVIPE